ncbi:MAG: type II toxin-antitoxin system VapC family toxin [Candidatus Heimdallarchaeota archaeon]
MAIFLDTSVIAAYLNIRDSRNRKAQDILERIWENEFGRVVTSDYVVDECYTLLVSRTGNFKLLGNLFDFIYGNSAKKIVKFIDFQHMTPELYDFTWKLYEKFQAPELSFTDLSILAMASKLGIEYLASFDGDFDGKMNRICQ